MLYVDRCEAPILHELTPLPRSRLIAGCEFLMTLPRAPLSRCSISWQAFLTFFLMTASAACVYFLADGKPAHSNIASSR